MHVGRLLSELLVGKTGLKGWQSKSSNPNVEAAQEKGSVYLECYFSAARTKQTWAESGPEKTKERSLKCTNLPDFWWKSQKPS